MFKRFFRKLFIRHEWETQGDVRVCKCCGQREEFDYGCGVAGSGWMPVEMGEKDKHLV